MSYKDEVKHVTINGQSVPYYSVDAVKKHAKLIQGEYWEQQKEYYVKVNPYWYTYTRTFNGHEWSKIAGITTIDFAVPQAWFDKNIKEIRRRGGVAWWYDRERFGEPLFFDDLRAMAMKNIKKYAPPKPVSSK
jgi:hypothetical protein